MADLTLDILNQAIQKIKTLAAANPYIIEIKCSYKTENDMIRQGNPYLIELLSPSAHCPDNFLVLRYNTDEIKMVRLDKTKNSDGQS